MEGYVEKCYTCADRGRCPNAESTCSECPQGLGMNANASATHVLVPHVYTPEEVKAIANSPLYAGNDCEVHLNPEVVPMLNAFAAMLGRIADRRLRNAEIKDMSVPLAYDLNVQLDYVLNGKAEE